MYGGLFVALVIAALLTILAVVFGRKGPWGTAWTFFLVLFLSLWLVAIYVRSVGPVYFGIALIPVIVAGVLLSFLLGVAIPNANQWRDASLRNTKTGRLSKEQLQEEVVEVRVGRVFWILVLLLIAAIIVGMANPQPAL